MYLKRVDHHSMAYNPYMLQVWAPLQQAGVRQADRLAETAAWVVQLILLSKYTRSCSCTPSFNITLGDTCCILIMCAQGLVTSISQIAA